MKTARHAPALPLLLIAGLSIAGCAATQAQTGTPPAAQATAPAAPAAAAQPADKKVVVKCPVMGGEVEVTPDALHSTYKGKDYYFCCAPCKVQFDKDPEKFVKE